MNETEQQVVAWLRTLKKEQATNVPRLAAWFTAQYIADAIERGEHRESDDASHD